MTLCEGGLHNFNSKGTKVGLLFIFPIQCLGPEVSQAHPDKQ